MKPLTAIVCAAIATLARGETPATREFSIPPDRQQMIGVTYAVATVKPLRRTIRAAGTVAAVTAKHWDYVARVDGYVRRLAVSAPGERVRRGQVLLDLYSPDLVATENEFVDLLNMRRRAEEDRNPAAAENAARLLAGAQARLRQWNISQEQIDAIAKAGKADEFLPLTSPVDGIVEEVGVHQGRHVAVGDHLVDLVDLSSVWVWAEFYESELPDVKPGLAVTITSDARPGFVRKGRTALVDPFLDPMKRTGRVRIDVDNPGLGLLPDAYVSVTVEIDDGAGLTIPAAAVLPTGERNLVFLDRGAGRLEPRFIQLGGRFGDDYRVMSGLRAGDRVAASANFLLDAESKAQGAQNEP